MNPFIISGYEGKNFFCNRTAEYNKLKEAFLNNRNVTLISLRRMGKSALIYFLAENLKNKADVIYADIFSARSFSDMTILAANAVTSYFGTSVKDYLKKTADLIKSIGATLKFNDITGKPELKFGLGDIKDQKSFNEIIQFLEKNSRKVLFVFDEFQQIKNFPEKNTDSILRTAVQKCRNINFMFLGSNKGMMDAIFTHSPSPFFQSTQYLYLEEIDRLEYIKFIREKFYTGKIVIKKEQAETILDILRSHTYYVQYLCNRLYAKHSKGILNDSEIYDTLNEILKENEPIYFNYKNLLSRLQWNLVLAVAKEDNVKEPLSSQFIIAHQLGSASSVKRALESLLKKEILIYYKDLYMVYDVFFSLWLKFNPTNQ